MRSLVISLGVGLVIGILFKSLKLPVPVPHGLGGLIGLVGMFIGSEMVSVLSRLAAKS
jgi:XapX domain-containing protein